VADTVRPKFYKNVIQRVLAKVNVIAINDTIFAYDFVYAPA
jgi:hypothetical protein